MLEINRLDAAYARMEANPSSNAARMSFYEAVSNTELFVLLATEADGQTIDPRMFPVADGNYVLVFDTLDRLADFVDEPMPYAGLSGRGIVGLLAQSGTGIGLNLGVGPSSFLIPADAVDWLAETLASAPETSQGKPARVAAPGNVSPSFLDALGGCLSQFGKAINSAVLVRADYADKGSHDLLVVFGADTAAHVPLSKAIGEAMLFSGTETSAPDVVFLDAADPAGERIRKVGYSFSQTKGAQG